MTDQLVPQSPTEDLPTPSPSPVHLKEYQLDLIAKLSAMNASSPEQISITTGIPIKSVNNLFLGNNSKFNKLQNSYREMVSKNLGGAKFNLIKKLEKCDRALDLALESGDARLARDTAFEIMDRVLPELNPRARSQAAESGINISITQNNPQAAILLNNTMDSVANMMKDLKGHLTLEGEVLSHELIGEEALPPPPGQLEVGSGEPRPSLEDSPQEEWLNLIPIPNEDPGS